MQGAARHVGVPNPASLVSKNGELDQRFNLKRRKQAKQKPAGPVVDYLGTQCGSVYFRAKSIGINQVEATLAIGWGSASPAFSVSKLRDRAQAHP
jgi:hypothetical protein